MDRGARCGRDDRGRLLVQRHEHRATEGSGGELQATRWVLSSYASEGALTVVPDGQYADARFTANRVKGFAGCNDFDAVYRTGARMLLISMPILTLAFCSEDANAFEGTYMSLLQASRFYSVRAGTLTIRGPDREILLMFDAAPRNPLLGSWVVDSYQDSTGAVVTPLPDTELTAVFRFAKVAGSSGCNTYQGPYTSNESIAAIGPLATTRMACAEDVMAQETAFLAALQGVGRIEPRADSVMLQDRNGGVSSSPSFVPRPPSRPRRRRLPARAPGRAPSVVSRAPVRPPPRPRPRPDADTGRQRHAGSDRRPARVAATGGDMYGDGRSRPAPPSRRSSTRPTGSPSRPRRRSPAATSIRPRSPCRRIRRP